MSTLREDDRKNHVCGPSGGLLFLLMLMIVSIGVATYLGGKKDAAYENFKVLHASCKIVNGDSWGVENAPNTVVLKLSCQSNEEISAIVSNPAFIKWYINNNGSNKQYVCSVRVNGVASCNIPTQ